MANAMYVARQWACLDRAVGVAGAAHAWVGVISHVREITAPTVSSGDGTRMPFAGSVPGRLRPTAFTTTSFPREIQGNLTLPAAAVTRDVHDVHPGIRPWSPPI